MRLSELPIYAARTHTKFTNVPDTNVFAGKSSQEYQELGTEHPFIDEETNRATRKQFYSK